MGHYMICIDNGNCIIVQADSAEEAGREARIRYPDAKTLKLMIDNVKNRALIATQ